MSLPEDEGNQMKIVLDRVYTNARVSHHYNINHSVSDHNHTSHEPKISFPITYSYEDYKKSSCTFIDRPEFGLTPIIGRDVNRQIWSLCQKNNIFGIRELDSLFGRMKAPPGTHMDWIDYHRLEDIHAFLDTLECTYPSLCSVAVIGKSLEGRDLKLLKISNSEAGNCAVWIDAGIHAREWIGPAVNTYVANYIANNFKTLPDYVTNKDWYFLPVANPDGYEYSHTVNRMWRKNMARIDGKLVGVDLNRNFSYAWGGKGSSPTPTHCFYRGKCAFSEPESCAMRDILSSGSITFKVYITLHSYGQVIIFPYASEDTLCPGYIRLLEGAAVMSKAIYDTNGNTYKVGISRDVMYRASGTSNDWSHGTCGIPYCYLLELRSRQHKYADIKTRFKLPKEEIEETGNEILNSTLALMEFVDKYPSHKLILENDNYDDLRNKFVNKIKVAQADKSITQVWEVRLIREGQRYFMRALDSVGAVNIWKEDANTVDIFVDNRNSSVAAMLQEREIPYSIVMPNVGALLEREKNLNAVALLSQTVAKLDSKVLCMKKDITFTMDWNKYHRLDTINIFMHDLVSKYPRWCSFYVIGKSSEGRNLTMLKISNGNVHNEGVWIDGAIHPREWISTAVVTYIADRLARTFDTQPSYVTNKDWYLMPVLNPDGYEYTHVMDRMWRKNRAPYGACIGVDLNRNFSLGWGENGEEGSSCDPGNVFYRGPQPFSEPETRAVRHAIIQADCVFKVFLSLHSYGEVIIFPWGYTGDPCPDYVEMLEGGTAMAKAIHKISGRTYKVGSTKDLMYYASGTSIDWCYGVAGIPYCYMLELRDKHNRFLLPAEDILDTGAEIFGGVLGLVEFIDKRHKYTQIGRNVSSTRKQVKPVIKEHKSGKPKKLPEPISSGTSSSTVPLDDETDSYKMTPSYQDLCSSSKALSYKNAPVSYLQTTSKPTESQISTNIKSASSTISSNQTIPDTEDSELCTEKIIRILRSRIQIPIRFGLQEGTSSTVLDSKDSLDSHQMSTEHEDSKLGTHEIIYTQPMISQKNAHQLVSETSSKLANWLKLDRDLIFPEPTLSQLSRLGIHTTNSDSLDSNLKDRTIPKSKDVELKEVKPINPSTTHTLMVIKKLKELQVKVQRPKSSKVKSLHKSHRRPKERNIKSAPHRRNGVHPIDLTNPRRKTKTTTGSSVDRKAKSPAPPKKRS